MIKSKLSRPLLYFISLVSAVNLIAQSNSGPCAKFDFNKRSESDLINGKKIHSMGVNFCDDRFGNANHALYVYGNEYSYINLGSYPELKPKVGTISLWVKIEREVFAGQGYKANPILLAKSRKEDDFYEAYGLYYQLDSKKISTTCSRDSLSQVGVYSKESIPLFEWQHLAITYDNSHFSFYLNGELQRTAVKKFETHFLDGDSVMIGYTANRKNSRYMEGAVDDIVFYNRVLSPKEIKALYEAPNPNQNTIILSWMLLGITIFAVITLLYFLIRWRLNIVLQKEKKRLEMNNLILQTELRVNRALMNPHFIFNSLNAIQNLILNNKNDQANDYLIKFSKLIRKILESNTADSIPLTLEIDILNRYFEIEELRFEEKFLHKIQTQTGFNPSNIEIPIMMVQPFVENAIWHGLMNKKGDKHLHIYFEIRDEIYLLCTIEDNGTGRQYNTLSTTDRKPLATIFVQNRLELFNKIYNLKCSLSITDKINEGGTVVKLLLPILNRIKP